MGDDPLVLLALAIFVAVAILAFPRNGRWFVRLQTRKDGHKEHYWRHAGSWELVGLGIIAVVFLVGMGRG